MGVLAITVTPTGATHEKRAGAKITWGAHLFEQILGYRMVESKLRNAPTRWLFADNSTMDAILAHVDDPRAELRLP